MSLHKDPNSLQNDSISIAPSLLAANFARLGDECRRAEESGADKLHIDIMDGHFVPNLSMGPHIVASVNKSTSLFLDVHLMMYNPFDYIERFIEVGADLISFHIEATEDVQDTIDFIKKCGKKAGLALCPDTPISMIIPFLAHIDQILIMTVHPGFGGQSFIEESIERIQEARSLVDQYDRVKSDPEHLIEIQVDGGIDEKNAIRARKAGATSFVSGTYLFNAEDMKSTIQDMRSKLQKIEVVKSEM